MNVIATRCGIQLPGAGLSGGRLLSASREGATAAPHATVDGGALHKSALPCFFVELSSDWIADQFMGRFRSKPAAMQADV